MSLVRHDDGGGVVDGGRFGWLARRCSVGAREGDKVWGEGEKEEIGKKKKD